MRHERHRAAARPAGPAARHPAHDRPDAAAHAALPGGPVHRRGLPRTQLLLITASFCTIVLLGQGYRAFVNFGLLLFAVMGVLFSTLGTAATKTVDLQAGFDARLLTMPISAWRY
ncbi:hypothetical protein [Dactylosporangium salmoneum]|uniref:Uncharacterized protein n=1 Tax=Dactylosporangium salmoneum TaxID=53361 RepID=A0ABN3GYD9_9ACTN